VLTAAHCAVSPGQVDVVLGRSKLSSSAGERLQVDQVVVHPLYSPATSRYDVALLHLTEPSSQPVMGLLGADQGSLAAPGVQAVTVGWGSTVPVSGPSGANLSGDNRYQGGPDDLRQVRVPIVSDGQCANMYAAAGESIHAASMICAGDIVNGGEDSCQGDSGGPLMVPGPGGNGWLLAGVVSWGFGCADPDYPGVYAEVRGVLDFIKDTAGAEITATCNGLPATIVGEGGRVDGTSGADVIVGTDGVDEIFALQGDDVICGLKGNDTIHGVDGDDTILAGPGADKIYPGKGADFVQGGGGADQVHELDGYADGDDIFGGGGTDTLDGGGGDDLLNGGTAGDKLNGGPGDDDLVGAAGNDELRGGDDSDDLWGGAGNDYLYGDEATPFPADICNGGSNGAAGDFASASCDSNIGVEVT
jgi:Ca2+-binding RTX toxin-like protein